MTLTRVRTIQYVGILLSLGLIAAGYWYFNVRAGVKTNTGAMQPQGTEDLSAGLAGYWKLDEGTGTSASDSGTNAITALTLTNGPTWTTGQIGSAVDFDGTNDYATTPDNALLEFSDTEDFTISGWFNRDTATTDDSIAFKRNGVFSTNSGYSVYIDDATDQLIFGVSDNTDPYSVTSTTTFTSSGWHHFVAVWDQDSVSGTTLYIDGVAEGTDSGTIGNIGAIDGTQPVIIGAESDGDNPFDGKLDEIRLYDRVLSTTEAAALYRLTTPTGVDTSLKGYWSLNSDALSGTTAYDRSGAGNTGTLTNGPAVTEGRIGQALAFDGSNDSVTIADSAVIEPTNPTIAAWFKAGSPQVSATYGGIVSKAESSGYFIEIDVDGTDCGTAGYLCAGVYISGSYRFVSTPVTLGEWHHTAMTYDGSVVTLYLDGVTVDTNSISGSITYNSEPLCIGADGASGTCSEYFFTGSIDESRVYNRALSATEIKSLYDRGTPDKSNTSAAQPGGTGNLNSGLAGYWKMDENTGTSASDASVNGNTGTLTNGPTWTTGQIGSSVDFDGTDDYISYANTIPFDANDFTLSAWVMRDGTAGGAGGYNIIFAQRVDGVGDGATDVGISLNPSHQALFFVRDNVGTGVSAVDTTATSTGVWYHVVGVKTSTAIQLYVNGTLVGTTSHSLSGDFDAGATHRFIGKERYSGADQNFLNGKVDEMRVYQRALSSDEVASLYRLTTPTGVDTSLRGYWSFNGQDTTSTIAYDRSGVGNNGTLTGGPPVVEGRVGQALSFDNVNDYVLAGSLTAVDDLETQGGGGLTASAWIYPESGGTFGGVIVGKRAAPSPGGGDWAFTMHQDGNAIKFYKSFSTTSLEATTLPGSIVLNKWQYVTATWSGGSTRSSVTFYIDGVLVPTSTSGGSDGVGTKDSDASNVVSISSQFVQYDGLIDEVRLHNRILSAAEVKALYDIGAPDKTNTSVSTPQGTGRLDSGLAGYWKLDENTGTSASDASTNGNTGTLTNGPTWTTGRIGSGIDFDGTNDYVTVADSATLDFGDGANFSLSIWFNRDTESTYDWVMVKRNGSAAGYELVIGNTGDYITFTVSDGTDSYVMYSNTQFTTTGWHHVVISWDDSSEDNSRVYIDGIDDTTSRTGTFSDVGDLSNATAFSIGENPSNLNAFDGKLDEARVYNRALSLDEVVQLYRLGAPTGTDTGLKGYWSFNGQDLSGTTASDRSGAGNTGTLTNGPAVTEGKIGQALSFDGSNDYVTMGDIAALDGVTAMTASAWVKTPSGMSAERHIIDKAACTGTADSGTFELWHSLGDGGKPSFTFYKNGGSPSDYRATSSVEMDDDQWHLITGTYDGSAVRIYVDGVETGSTAAVSVTSPSTSNTVQIGGNCNGNPFPWLGSIDEARIYNRALSASEIKALYSSGR